jgi:hypothetical protein
MTKIDHLRSLSRLCRRFGGRLAIISQERFNRLFEGVPRHIGGRCESPFTSAHGIHWRRKIIYSVQGREEVGSIIHEMGHVFADANHPDSGKCHEFDFFGWEITVARLTGASRVWSQQSSNYIIDEAGSEWGPLTPPGRRTVVAERIAIAKKIGTVTLCGSPRSVR